MRHYIKLMRVHHYIKNLLVFAALACSGQIFRLDKLLIGTAGFLAFCMTASVVYIVNDIQDRERDRLHPTKCRRPIASGTVSVGRAKLLGFVLAVLALVFNGVTGHRSAGLLLILYLLLNLGYSCGLKNIPLVDVAILVAGFLIRMLYGALITGVEISNWLYLTVFSMALYFAFGKRRNELRNLSGKETRKVLEEYSLGFLDKSMYMCLTLANVFYVLWTMDEATIAFYNTRWLTLTAPIVLLISLRYSIDIEGESDGDPVEVLLHDRILLGLVIPYLLLMFWFLYL